MQVGSGGLHSGVSMPSGGAATGGIIAPMQDELSHHGLATRKKQFQGIVLILIGVICLVLSQFVSGWLGILGIILTIWGCGWGCSALKCCQPESSESSGSRTTSIDMSDHDSPAD